MNLNIALRRIFHPNPLLKGATAMRNPINLVSTALVVALTLPATAFAQDPDPAPPTDPAPTAEPGELFALDGSTEDFLNFAHTVERYGMVTTQGKTRETSEASASQILGDDATKFSNFLNTLDTLRLLRGEKVPEAMLERINAHLEANECGLNPDANPEDESTKWTEGCETFAGVLRTKFDELAADAPDTDYTANAKRTRSQAEELYYGGDQIFALYDALAQLTPQLPPEARPWAIGGANGLPDGVDADRARHLVGQRVCVHSGSGVACDTVADVTEDGVMVGSTLVRYDDLEKAMVMGELPEGLVSAANPNAGFVLALETDWGMVHTPGLTATRTLSVGLAGQFNLKRAPIAFRLSAGYLRMLSGGLADHYTHRREGGSNGMGYFTAGVGYVPMFTDHVGFNVMPKGVVTTTGGGGLMVDLGPTFYLGEESNWLLAPQVSVGYLDLNRTRGGNNTSPMADPDVAGFRWNVGLTFGRRF